MLQTYSHSAYVFYNTLCNINVLGRAIWSLHFVTWFVSVSDIVCECGTFNHIFSVAYLLIHWSNATEIDHEHMDEIRRCLITTTYNEAQTMYIIRGIY